MALTFIIVYRILFDFLTGLMRKIQLVHVCVSVCVYIRVWVCAFVYVFLRMYV